MLERHRAEEKQLVPPAHVIASCRLRSLCL
jgi:hypothetical protein